MITPQSPGTTGRRATGTKKNRPIDRGLSFVAEHTFALKEKMWMENLARNMPVILESGDIKNLPKCNGSAVVIGAGPSVEKYGQLEVLEGSGYRGTVIATDKMFKPCLKAGVVPSLVMTADGDPSIASFYEGAEIVVGDTFRFSNLAVKGTRAVLNVITHPETIAKIPHERHFYMTPYDDPFAKKSLTRAVHFMTKKTIMSSLGNVGGQAFNLAYFLQADPVILVGLDYGYPSDMPLGETSYFKSYEWLAKRRGKELGQFFTKIRNPDTGNEVVLDANWAVYRELALRHFERAKCRIVNASPISSLFGKNIQYVPLKEALEKWGR